MNRISYDADFYGWANEQAALLREGRPWSFDEIMNPDFWPQ